MGQNPVFRKAAELWKDLLSACPAVCHGDGRDTQRQTSDFINTGDCSNVTQFMNLNDEFAPGLYPRPACTTTRLNNFPKRSVQMAEADVLRHSSRTCYMFDQGNTLPAVQPAVTYGGPRPKPFEYGSWALAGSDDEDTDTDDESETLTKLEAIQNIYFLINGHSGSTNIRKRLMEDRPEGERITVTSAEADQILKKMKAELEKVWSNGWGGSDGPMEFNAFIDDNSVAGTFSFAMEDMVLAVEELTVISFVVQIIIAIWFLFECGSMVRSRISLGFCGVVATILALGGGMGFFALFHKWNVALVWTVPFLLVGIGIDDMYIMSLAAPHLPPKVEGAEVDMYFIRKYEDVAVPMTMTSITLVSMFAIMYMIEVPAVYLTALCATIATVFLWSTMMLSFSAMVFIDLKRQAAQRLDLMCCMKGEKSEPKPTCLEFGYKFVYKPIVGSIIGKIFIFIIGAGLLGVAAYGFTDVKLGLTIGDFARDNTQLRGWVDSAEAYFGTWGYQMNWLGDGTDFTSTEAHMRMMKNWEAVAEQDRVLANNTQSVLFATMGMWGLPRSITPLYNRGMNEGRFSSDYCNSSFTLTGGNCSDRLAHDPPYSSQAFVTRAESCTSSFAWEGEIGLKLYAEPGEAIFSEQNSYRGVCLKGSDIISYLDGMPDCVDSGFDASDYVASRTYCPVMHFNDTDHFLDCYELMAAFTTLDSAVGAFTYDQLEPRTGNEQPILTEYPKLDPEAAIRPRSPVKVVMANGGLNVHLEGSDDYVEVIRDTRPHCDDKRGSGDPKCFIDGIAYTYWEQYLEIETWLLRAVVVCLAFGWIVSFLFLFLDLVFEEKVEGSCLAKFWSAFASGFLITFICAYSTFLTTGISLVLETRLSGFSGMSCILSVGFAVEYAVHIVHRFVKAPDKLASDRAMYAAQVLFKPTFMAFISTAVGVVCMGFSGIEFVTYTFFVPLIVCVLTTYFAGLFVLPLLLTLLGPCIVVGLDASKIERDSVVFASGTEKELEDDGL